MSYPTVTGTYIPVASGQIISFSRPDRSNRRLRRAVTGSPRWHWLRRERTRRLGYDPDPPPRYAQVILASTGAQEKTP